MTREDILATTQRIRDLHYFYDILTSGTPGAERAWEAMDDLNFPNPMALTSYLLENKDFFLRYCDDEGSRIRTARTALLMYAASVDGRSKAKDDQLANIADNKIKVYNFEWNDANSNWSAAGAIDVLKDLPLEDKADIVEDVTSVFEAGGGITEKQQGLIDHLNEVFGLNGDDKDSADGLEDDETPKSTYAFAHPGRCSFMPQRLMEATYTDILTRLRLDDSESRQAFLSLDRKDAAKQIYDTYRDVVGHASPSLMRIVQREGQGNPKAYGNSFIELMTARIYDSMKALQEVNGDDILCPDAPDILKPLHCLDQVMNSAGYLQENMESDGIDAGSVQYLKVVGTIGAPDFRFLRDQCSRLEVLDISDALICDYEGEDGPDGNITYYDSLEIPLGAFCYGKLRDGKAGHQHLAEILFHEDTYMIQRGAFMGCSKLQNIFLPDKMEVLDEKAFMYCDSLEYVYLGGTGLIKNGAFNGCKTLKDIVCPGDPPTLGNPNQSPEMKRFATPVFSPHEMDGSGLEVRAIRVPDSKEAAYERSEWKDIAGISGDTWEDHLEHGRGYFEIVLDNYFEWMAERDNRVAMMTFLAGAVCDDNGAFSDSAWETILEQVKTKIPISRDIFEDVLQDPDINKAARLLEGMDTDELRDFIQDLHSAITKEGVNERRISIMQFALSLLDDDRRRDVLGDAFSTYYPKEKKEAPKAPEKNSPREDKPKESTEPKKASKATKKTPTAPEKAPSSPKKTPSAPEKAPSSPKKTPTAPEKAPSSPKKATTAPERTPSSPKKASKAGSTPESWSVIGSFDSWNKDIAMTKVMEGIWVSPWIRCSAGDAFKVRCNGSWDNNLGGKFKKFGEAFKAVPNGDNIMAPAAGKYIVTLNTKENAIILTKEDGPVEEEKKEEKKPSPAKSVTPKKAETAPKPQAVPAAKPVKRTATINSVKADHNVVVNGKKGVTLHINFDIANCKGTDCKCAAWLHYADGRPVKDTNGSFCASDGHVATWVSFKPIYENTHFDDLHLFFPYDEFHIEGKDVGCYLSLRVQSESGAFISPEYKENMTYSSGNMKTVKFDRIWCEDSNGESLVIHIKMTIDHALNEEGGIGAWFYNSSGKALRAKASEMNMYKTPDGNVTVQLPIKPNFESCLWDDLRMSIPYSALNLASDHVHDIKFNVGVFFGKTHLPYSDYMSIRIEAKRGLFSGIKYKLIK